MKCSGSEDAENEINVAKLFDGVNFDTFLPSDITERVLSNSPLVCFKTDDQAAISIQNLAADTETFIAKQELEYTKAELERLKIELQNCVLKLEEYSVNLKEKEERICYLELERDLVDAERMLLQQHLSSFDHTASSSENLDSSEHESEICTCSHQEREESAEVLVQNSNFAIQFNYGRKEADLENFCQALPSSHDYKILCKVADKLNLSKEILENYQHQNDEDCYDVMHNTGKKQRFRCKSCVKLFSSLVHLVDGREKLRDREPLLSTTDIKKKPSKVIASARRVKSLFWSRHKYEAIHEDYCNSFLDKKHNSKGRDLPRRDIQAKILNTMYSDTLNVFNDRRNCITNIDSLLGTEGCNCAQSNESSLKNNPSRINAFESHHLNKN